MKPPPFQFYADEYLAGTIAMRTAKVVLLDEPETNRGSTTVHLRLEPGANRNLNQHPNRTPNRTRAEVWPTLAQALALAELRSIPADCAEKWWLEHDARGGLNARGQAITRWGSSLQAYAVAWRANHQRDRQRRGGDARPRGVPEPRQVAEDIAMPIFFDPSSITP